MSELLSHDLTLTTTQVPSATFSLTQFSVRSRCLKLRVICAALEWYIQAWLSSSIEVGPWTHPIMFRMPLLAMTSALSVWLTALISDSAVDVDMLPWSVEHQQIRLRPRYPRYAVWEWLLSGLPPKSNGVGVALS